MKEEMKAALIAHPKGHIEKHRMNVNIYFNNPVGIGEHPDVIEAVEKELNMIAEYHDQIEVLEKYF